MHHYLSHVHHPELLKEVKVGLVKVFAAVLRKMHV